MIPPWSPHRLLRWLAPAAALVAAAVLAAPAGAASHAKSESYSAFQSQLSAGQVKAATVVPKKHTMNVKLRSGAKYRVTYPSSADPVAALRAQHVRVRVKKTSSSSHVRLRYIVLAVVAALAIAGGVAYLVRRRGPPAPDTAAGPSPPA
jgi:ATP-dependent Zn protease